MKFLLLSALALFAIGCDNQDNLRDGVDANITPAPLEEREEEFINSPDIIDRNEVPASEEERLRDEESIYQNEESI